MRSVYEVHPSSSLRTRPIITPNASLILCTIGKSQCQPKSGPNGRSTLASQRYPMNLPNEYAVGMNPKTPHEDHKTTAFGTIPKQWAFREVSLSLNKYPNPIPKPSLHMRPKASLPMSERWSSLNRRPKTHPLLFPKPFGTVPTQICLNPQPIPTRIKGHCREGFGTSPFCPSVSHPEADVDHQRNVAWRLNFKKVAGCVCSGAVVAGERS
jgi:hypothetical protein